MGVLFAIMGGTACRRPQLPGAWLSKPQQRVPNQKHPSTRNRNRNRKSAFPLCAWMPWWLTPFFQKIVIRKNEPNFVNVSSPFEKQD